MNTPRHGGRQGPNNPGKGRYTPIRIRNKNPNIVDLTRETDFVRPLTYKSCGGNPESGFSVSEPSKGVTAFGAVLAIATARFAFSVQSGVRAV